jgi:hypothetical protein
MYGSILVPFQLFCDEVHPVKMIVDEGEEELSAGCSPRLGGTGSTRELFWAPLLFFLDGYLAVWSNGIDDTQFSRYHEWIHTRIP